MKKTLSFCLFIIAPLFMFSQSTSQRKVVVFEPHQLNQINVKLLDGKQFHKGACLAEVPLQQIEPFLAYSIVWYAADWQPGNSLKAFFHNGKEATDAVDIRPEHHATPVDGQHISQLYFTEKDAKKIRLQFSGSDKIERIEVHFFSPGKTKNPAPAITGAGNRSACPCPQPDFLDRLGWCPDGSCPEDATPAPTTVTHLIVHHSAGSNTSSDWSATVRSIYDFHVFVNEWDDVGYNWLIDPNGVIYQGRGDNVRGAHFCGTNGGTMGVCMLGTYTTVVPTDGAYTALENLLAWKSCDVNVEPDGSAFHASSGLDLMHISGHRDGCATECPGNALYPTLPSIRDNVLQKLNTECNDFVINAPTNLVVQLNADNKIQLIWEDNADNESGYQIERSFNLNNDFIVVDQIPADSEEYIDDANLTFAYYYRVKAVVGDSSSTYSNEAFYEPLSSSHSFLNESTVSIFPNPTEGISSILINSEFIGKMKTVLSFKKEWLLESGS
ncbi:MAG: N-acetylmuramoyl-L-alanine amidase [Bacteroidota bacterium]